MSEKQRNEPPVKLTRAEKREIQAIIRKYKGDGKAHSAQASIPYQAMYPDGVCRVTANTFSKCIEFADISYQLAQADTKTAIFENLCDLYNYLDASIHVQFSFVNRKTDPKQYAKSFEIKAQGDDFDDIRAEYSGILQDQLVRGNNGLTKRKFLTFTIEADNLKMARARLTRIETDLLGYFKTMGAVAHVLDAKERLEVLHGVLHPDAEPFQFEWKWLAPSGLSTKDFIAPSSFRFGNSRMFGLGGKYGAVSFLNILSPELSDEMLADFLNTENGIVVNLHVQAIDQSDAIKTVKRKITDLDAMKIQEQKRAVRSGYDMDILPSDLATYGQDAKELLKTLQSRNERMFQLTFLVLNTADTRQKLENDVFWAAGIAQKYNCSLVRLDYQQEQGLMSSLPLGASHIQIERSLTTSSVAVFVPFVTQELFQGGDAMYYGINAKTGNMIMLDRKRARCPNGLKLGTPGSGKSMSCKSEIVSVFLCTPDDVYICDPEAEYYGDGENRVVALDHANLEIVSSDFISIMGPSGSGKSTLLHLLSGLDKPSSGSLTYDGKDIYSYSDKELSAFRRKRIGFIFQQFNLLPVLTAKENIIMPLLLDKQKPDEAYLKQLTELLGIQGRLEHLPHELSGGQQQRVAIARALIAKPDVIFADEPTGNLDSKSGGEVMELLQNVWKKMGKALVVITHDSRIARMADRQFQIVDGVLTEVTAK